MFEKGTYNKLLLSRYLSEEEYENIIYQSGKLIGNCLINKKKNDTIETPRLLIFLLILSVLLMIGYFIALVKSFNSKEEFEAGNALNEGSFAIAIILVVSSIAVMIFISIFNYLRPIRKFRNLGSFIKEDIGKYLEEVNKKYYGKVFFSIIDGGSESTRFIEVRVADNEN